MKKHAAKIDGATSRTDSSDVAQMFDRISPRYDLLNHGLSLSLDRHWRKRLAHELRNIPDGRILDVATGTGDQALAIAAETSDFVHIIGVDVATRMLEKASIKGGSSRYRDRLYWVHGDALRLPFASASIRALTISFGIRNIPDIPLALQEFRRVLRPDGLLLILEFGMPDNPLLRPLYQFYFRFILPLLGGLISGDFKAYRYLNKSVETFPYSSDFVSILEKAGFPGASYERMTCGITYLYKANNPG